MKLLIEHNGGLGDAIIDTAFIKKLKEKLAKPLPKSLKRSRVEQLKAREAFLKRMRQRKAG